MKTDWMHDRERYGRQAWLIQPSYWAVAVYRFGRWTIRAPKIISPFAHILYFALYSIVRLLTGIDIPRTALVGPGLMIHHFGGVTVHPQAKIGSHFTLRQGVTIGSRRDGGPVPVIGNYVNVGAYAQVLGEVVVGDRASIGAMTVVLEDVPAQGTVVGNPGRLIRK